MSGLQSSGRRLTRKLRVDPLLIVCHRYKSNNQLLQDSQKEYITKNVSPPIRNFLLNQVCSLYTIIYQENLCYLWYFIWGKLTCLNLLLPCSLSSSWAWWEQNILSQRSKQWTGVKEACILFGCCCYLGWVIFFVKNKVSNTELANVSCLCFLKLLGSFFASSISS